MILKKLVTKTKWNKIWTQESSFLGLLFFKDAEKKAIDIMERVLIPRSKIVDIGCGSGRTLSFIVKNFPNSIGLDFSKTSIKICKNKGLKVLKRDAKNTGFKKNSVDLVFSEGLLEHYPDMSPIVNEMCRISKKYVLLIQPNPNSIVIPFRQLSHNFFRRKYGKEIPEIRYNVLDYCKQFQKFGFTLIEKREGIFGLLNILLFIEEKVVT